MKGKGKSRLKGFFSGRREMRKVRQCHGWDVRQSVDAVHDQVLERLGDPATNADAAGYLHAFWGMATLESDKAAYLRHVGEFLTDKERASLYDDKVTLLYQEDVCGNCGRSHAWELDERRGERVCACGGVVRNVAGAYDYEGAASRYLPFDRRDKRMHHAYRRVTHFTNCLGALTRRKLPQGLLEKVEQECDRQRLDRTRLVLDRVRQLMKVTGLHAHYPMAPVVLATLLGVQIPRLSLKEQKVLYNLFEEVERVFDEDIALIEKGRHNFLSYNYLLKECLHRMGRDDVGCWIPPLKTVEKQRKQERIFSALKKRLEWDTF